MSPPVSWLWGWCDQGYGPHPEARQRYPLQTCFPWPQELWKAIQNITRVDILTTFSQYSRFGVFEPPWLWGWCDHGLWSAPQSTATVSAADLFPMAPGVMESNVQNITRVDILTTFSQYSRFGVFEPPCPWLWGWCDQGYDGPHPKARQRYPLQTCFPWPQVLWKAIQNITRVDILTTFSQYSRFGVFEPPCPWLWGWCDQGYDGPHPEARQRYPLQTCFPWPQVLWKAIQNITRVDILTTFSQYSRFGVFEPPWLWGWCDQGYGPHPEARQRYPLQTCFPMAPGVMESNTKHHPC